MKEEVLLRCLLGSDSSIPDQQPQNSRELGYAFIFCVLSKLQLTYSVFYFWTHFIMNTF